MARNPSMRASDVERDRFAAALQEHCAQGRLSVDEFEERLEGVYAARTVGDLEQLTADLPEEDLYELPVPAHREGGPPSPSRSEVDIALPGGVWPWLWGTWAVVSALNFAIWLLLVALLPLDLHPWWIWVAGPWGVLQLGAHIADRRYGSGSS